MKCLTRREVIKAWQLNKYYLESYVCPDCRNILLESVESISNRVTREVLACQNLMCKNSSYYDVKTGEVL